MKKFFKEMFSRDAVNTGRQIEIDIAKAICIIGMVLVHAFEELPNIAGSGGAGEFFLLRIGNTIFGATLFMFCMGVGISYTKKNTPGLIILRGLTILIIGIVLNFLRYGLGMIITNAVNPNFYSSESIIIEILGNDILIFAGLAMMLFGLLKKIKLPGWAILVISIVMSVLGTIFKGYDLHNVWGNCLVGWFIGTSFPGAEFNTTSYFPLLNWFILVAAGYCFAWILKRVEKKSRFYMVFSSFSAICIGLYIGLCIGPKVGFFQEDFRCTFHIATYDALISLCGAVFAFGLYYGLSKILPKIVLKGATTMSKYINTIYCLQWVIYGNLVTIFDCLAPSLVFEAWQAMLCGFGILIVCVFIAWIYKGVIVKTFKRYKEVSA